MMKSAHQLVLAINSGSSSLKVGLFDRETIVWNGLVDGIGKTGGTFRLTDAEGRVIAEKQEAAESQDHALSRVLEVGFDRVQDRPVAIGHRIVHGGPELLEHQPITPDVLAKMKAAEHFAPLHMPQALSLIRQTQQMFPDALQVACFDTAFHRNMPEIARRFALPIALDSRGVHRYGFHGLSYESLVHRLGDRLPQRAVLAHLGSGSSLCALRYGISVDTTMGMTPTGGIVMATRSGDLDPGVLLFLLRSEKLSVDDLEKLLNHEAGLTALSGGEADMQRLLAMQEAGDPRADLAVRAYCASVRKAVGAYAALLGGIDLLVFTGGIGAHSAEIRSMICKNLKFLNLFVESDRVLALPAEEELQIARTCLSLI